MISIKVKLRLSPISGQKGTVYYQLTQGVQSRQISTSIHVYAEDWDFEDEAIRPESHYYSQYQPQIEQDVAYLWQLAERLATFSTVVTPQLIQRCYRQTGTRQCVLRFMRDEIQLLINQHRMATANNYRHTLMSLSHFLGGQDIPFILFNETFIGQYEVYLIQRGLVRNSISFYMRVLRAVYNKAVRKHCATHPHPFHHVYTGIDRTRKRAISETWIARLYQFPLPKDSKLELARDLFIFSYCTRGMAFVDMAHLRKSDVSDGFISYYRHKTNQYLSIKIETEIRQIIKRYGVRQPQSPFVFPILEGNDLMRDFRRYNVQLNSYNLMLKKLAGMIGCKSNLTSYVARHSWATSARQHNIPISVISAGLGHESQKTTEIYLKEMEGSAIDKANRRIIRQLRKN